MFKHAHVTMPAGSYEKRVWSVSQQQWIWITVTLPQDTEYTVTFWDIDTPSEGCGVSLRGQSVEYFMDVYLYPQEVEMLAREQI